MSTHTSTNPNMVDNLLFEQFATLATAPDGIGRLRDLILQLAVQGRRCCTACNEDCGYTDKEDVRVRSRFMMHQWCGAHIFQGYTLIDIGK